MEVWKDIEGYEGLYQVSNLGRVKSLKRIVNRGTNFKPVNERILKPSYNKDYAYIVLSKHGITKSKFIHQLVARAFIPNPNNYPIINHKDENPRNNRADNLEWCTHSYNLSYKDLRKRVAISKRKAIRQYSKSGEFIKEWSHAREAAEQLGLNKRAIYECCKGRCKTSGGYIWKRVEDIQEKHLNTLVN